MKTRVWGAGCAAIVGSLLTFSAQAVEVVIAAKYTSLDTYEIEVEIQDFGNADTIDVVTPDFGTFPLAFDSAENNWDVVGEDLDLDEVQTFFANTFDIQINNTGGQSIYRGEGIVPPGASDFPEPASFLTVSESANPRRPTASWTGGDDTANAMIITYQSGDDEFADGFEPAEENSSRTLSFDLEPGFYNVTLGFWDFLGRADLQLITGDDVLGVSKYDIATVGETFSGITIVPLPATAWLLLSGLGTLITIRRRNR
jgi:hypothetical protein